jgi:hypothetical protein
MRVYMMLTYIGFVEEKNSVCIELFYTIYFLKYMIFKNVFGG